jgi:hypothetical protein
MYMIQKKQLRERERNLLFALLGDSESESYFKKKKKKIERPIEMRNLLFALWERERERERERDPIERLMEIFYLHYGLVLGDSESESYLKKEN